MVSKTIVFIHGMYMTSLCWGEWPDYFQARGYRCMAPGWPGREQSVMKLRESHPDPQLGQLTLGRIIEHYTSLIQDLDEKPILIGHSMGGLVVQLLLQRQAAIAGVAISSASPQGVFSTKWTFLRSNFPHINPFANQNIPIWMGLKRFQSTFVNALPLEQQQEAYEKYAVPESRRVPVSSLSRAARVNFNKPHAPLLLVAGTEDHLIPASLVRANWSRYKRSPSITDFKEFAGRCHFILGQSNWQEVAESISLWLNDMEV
jgi:pimeloyl-ACP methyl ester carboxylesterase